MIKRLKRFIKDTPFICRSWALHILSTLVLICCVLFTPFSAKAQCKAKGDGKLSIYSYHLGEYVDVTYRTGNTYNQAGIEKIFTILRSLDGETKPINLQLIDIIDNIQDHFDARTVEIISGFRSPNYNKQLKEEGHNVARESLHVEGKAIDFHIDEATEEAVRDYAMKLECGGVGYYSNNDFVHVDVGPVRRWGSISNGRKLVGMKNNPSLHELITDKNDYFKGNIINIKFTNKSSDTIYLNSCAELETFRNGKWISAGNVKIKFSENNLAPSETMTTQLKTEPIKCKSEKNLKLDFGRLRIKFINNNSTTLSNEFYLKKI